jgi:hypothetical protein
MTESEYYIDEEGQRWLGSPRWVIRCGHWSDDRFPIFRVKTEEAAQEIVAVLNKHLSALDPGWIYDKPFRYTLHKGIKIVPSKGLPTREDD